MNQATLFDPSRTSPTPCPVPGCQAIRFPQQDKVPTCEYERQWATTLIPGRRPRNCLNSYDPAHSELPDGY